MQHNNSTSNAEGEKMDGMCVLCSPFFVTGWGGSFRLPASSRSHISATEHRVLTSPSQPRYSAPFFYNPAYAAAVAPLPSLGEAQFDELHWGYFRAQRFAGDFADYGTEIQISDFAKGSGSWHVENQRRFLEEVDFGRAFDVEEMRPLLAKE